MIRIVIGPGDPQVAPIPVEIRVPTRAIPISARTKVIGGHLVCEIADAGDGLKGKIYTAADDQVEIDETIAAADLVDAGHYTHHRDWIRPAYTDAGLPAPLDKDLGGGSAKTQMDDIKALVAAKLDAGQETTLLDEVAAWNASQAQAVEPEA